MGRVEKILVVAIFGVVVMILGVTAFLPDATREPARQEQTASPGPADATPGPTAPRDGEALTPIERLLRSDLAGGGATPPGTVAQPPGDAQPAGAGPAVVQPGITPAPAPAGTPGSGRRGQQVVADPRYVKVKVAAGETLGEIVRRECGSLRFLDDARALNEQLDADMVFAGQEILLPYLAPEKLPAVMLADRAPDTDADNRLATLPLAMRGAAREAEPRDAAMRDAALRGEGSPRDAAAAPPASHKVRKGETLWGIAETRWGRPQAAKKVAEILALNRDKLGSERALKEGQVIRLPK